MFWFILWGVLFVWSFYYYCIHPLNHWKKRGVRQGHPVWVFGDSFDTIFRRESFVEANQRLYKEHSQERYSGIYQMMSPILLIRDPELIKQITVKDFDHFVDHRQIIPDTDPLLSRNLFTLKGEKWKEMRSAVSPCFTSSKMKAMFVLMCEVAETFVSYYNKQADVVLEVEIRDLLTKYANDVIASIAFGIKVDSLNEKDNKFYSMTREATDFSKFRMAFVFFVGMLAPKLLSLLKISVFSQRVRDFFITLINDTIRIKEEKGIVRPDMVQLLLETRKSDQKQEEKVTTNVETGFATVEEADLLRAPQLQKRNITNLDIAAHAVTFFLVGFDSIATTTSFIAYELSVNPDIQERLRNEIEITHQECNGKLTYEALMKMKYMDMVVSETLRRWANNVVLDRICTKPYTIQPTRPNEKPLELKKGDAIWISTSGIHNDSQYYTKPEKFDPERFNDENRAKIKPYTFLPFGAGPRNCIGSRFALLECKTLVYFLLRAFELVPIKKTDIPLKIARDSMMLRAENGIWLGLKSAGK